MTRSGIHESLGWSARPAGAASDSSEAAFRHHHFEVSSRGDRVAGSWLEPLAANGPLPLVVLAHPSKTHQAEDPTPFAADLARQRWSVAEVDLPLYGSRAEHKLAACVDAGWAGDGVMAPLAREFADQCRCDLRCVVDALSQQESIDASRVAFIGVDLGAHVGASFCAQDPRLTASVLVFSQARQAAPDLDPSSAIAAIAPRRLMLIDAGQADAERLRAAAPPPAVHHTLGAPRATDSDDTRSAIRHFLSEALGR